MRAKTAFSVLGPSRRLVSKATLAKIAGRVGVGVPSLPITAAVVATVGAAVAVVTVAVAARVARVASGVAETSTVTTGAVGGGVGVALRKRGRIMKTRKAKIASVPISPPTIRKLRVVNTSVTRLKPPRMPRGSGPTQRARFA